MNYLNLIRKYFYDAFVIISLVFAVPFILAGNIGYLWAFITLSFSLGLRQVAKISRNVERLTNYSLGSGTED